LYSPVGKKKTKAPVALMPLAPTIAEDCYYYVPPLALADTKTLAVAAALVLSGRFYS
jgi:hypothetical protein